MNESLPYRQALSQALQLTHRNWVLWSFCMIATFFVSENICETNLILEGMKEQERQQRAEIRHLIKKIDQKQTTLSFAQKKEPFFMERLLREKFNLIHRPQPGE
jgi:hypothetical protein